MIAKKDTDTLELFPLSPLLEQRPFQPASSRVRAEFGALSHPGLVRTNNEDHYLIIRLGRDQETLMTNLPEGDVPQRFEEWGYLMFVADGVGGAASGEVASRLAISTVVHLALHYGKWNLRIDQRTAREVIERAGRFYRLADEVVKGEAQTDPSLHGMATTLTAAYSAGNDLFIAHVGDSRAYLFRDGRLIQLTRDQTYAQSLADAGHIAQEEVSTNHLRHILTDAIGGSGGKVMVEIERLRLENGDCLLLCTDGLTEMVEEAKIAEVLALRQRPDVACQTLVDLALEQGGADNVTVLLGQYQIPETG